MTTKTLRKIIKIDEDKCNGCGLCVTTCAEGALAIIDGKAKLISEKYCDGLGACLKCPEGALGVVEREADEFDEEAVKVHLETEVSEPAPCGCPGSAMRSLEHPVGVSNCCEDTRAPAKSELTYWPVQLRLVPPNAPFLQGADVMLTADCVPFAYPGFHQNLLKGHALLVACPKLDDYQAHLTKLTEVLRRSDVNSLTVTHMEVPCCMGLVHLARQAISASGRDIPLREVTVGVNGEILGE